MKPVTSKFVKVRSRASELFNILSFQSLLNGWNGPLGLHVHPHVELGPNAKGLGHFHLDDTGPKKNQMDLMRKKRNAQLTQFLTGRHALCLPHWATGLNGLCAKMNASMRALLTRWVWGKESVFQKYHPQKRLSTLPSEHARTWFKLRKTNHVLLASVQVTKRTNLQ